MIVTSKSSVRSGNILKRVVVRLTKRLFGLSGLKGTRPAHAVSPAEERQYAAAMAELSASPNAAKIRRVLSATYRTGRYGECAAALAYYRAAGFDETDFVTRTAALLAEKGVTDFGPVLSGLGQAQTAMRQSTIGKAELPDFGPSPYTTSAELADLLVDYIEAVGVQRAFVSLQGLCQSLTTSLMAAGGEVKLTPMSGLLLLAFDADKVASGHGITLYEGDAKQSASMTVRRRGSTSPFSFLCLDVPTGVESLSLALHPARGQELNAGQQYQPFSFAEVDTAKAVTLIEGLVSEHQISEALHRLDRIPTQDEVENILSQMSARYFSWQRAQKARIEWITANADLLTGPSQIAGFLDWAGSDESTDPYELVNALFFDQHLLRLPAALARHMLTDTKYQRNRQRTERLRKISESDFMLDRLPMLAAHRPPAVDIRPRKVVSFLHQARPFVSNGYAIRSHHLLSAIKEMDWEVVSVARPGFPTESDDSPSTIDVDGLTYRFLKGPMHGHLSDWRYVHAAADSCTRLVAEENPELVHAASGYLTAWPALMAARRLGLPFVYEVRGFWDLSVTAGQPHLAERDLAQCIHANDTRLCQAADAVVTLTEAMRQQLIRRGISGDKIVVAPNGVDIEEHAPGSRDDQSLMELGLDPNRMTVGYVGSLLAYEGLDILLDALAMVQQRGGDFNLLIVGEGADRKRLEAKAKKLGLDKQTAFTGRVAPRDAARLYDLIDLCPFPRLPYPVCELVSPLKPFEAMARAKAVFVSDVAAMKEFLVEGVNALGFEKGNVNVLAEKLFQGLKHPDQARDLGHSARRWVSAHRNWEIAARAVERAFEIAAQARLDGRSAPAANPTLLPADGAEMFVDAPWEGWCQLDLDILPLTGTKNPPVVQVDVEKLDGGLIAPPGRDDIAYCWTRLVEPSKAVLQLPLNPVGQNTRARFKLPASTDGYRITIRPGENAAILMQGEGGVRVSPSPEARNVEGQLRIGLIADAFTTTALSEVAECVPLSRSNFVSQLDAHTFDLIVCESAWEGNRGEWARGVGWYSDEEIADLARLVETCRARGIPTVFFNKEDPVHFARFSKTAALFDHVATTDGEMVPRYLTLPNSKIKTARATPFFANVKVHHPFETSDRDKAICYAGTYYGPRYAQRTHDLSLLLEAASCHDLVVYDRQRLHAHSPYQFPENLRTFVKDGLAYEDMLNAYRQHGTFLNVNSVANSPTMYSRRVVEALASGAAVVSGPGRGLDRVLQGSVPTVSSHGEASQIISRVARDEAYRDSLAQAGARVVRRALTAGHWLSAIARDAGLAYAEGVRLPTYAARLTVPEHLSTAQLAATLDELISQSHPPEIIILSPSDHPALEDSTAVQEWERWASEVGVDLVVDAGQINKAFAEADYHVTLTAGCWLGHHCFEDMLALALSEPAIFIGKAGWYPVDKPNPDRRSVIGTAVPFRKDSPLDPRCVLRRRGSQSPTGGSFVGLSGNLLSFAPARPKSARKRMLIAGHDLKFIKPFEEHLEAAGFDLIYDRWTGHNRHDRAESATLLEQADVVFCEWMLGNAAWYAKHIHPEQTLVTRFHRQELETPYPASLQVERFHKVFFVSSLTRQDALERFGWKDGTRFINLGNGVDINALDLHKPDAARFALGFVGMVPMLKQVHKALDILALLRAKDPRFTLRIKGKLPRAYAWLKDRPDERAYYKRFWERLGADPLLQGAVSFDGYDDDMPQWYSKVGFVLSTSLFESFHYTVADGAASGAVPIILPRPGVSEIFGDQWTCEDSNAAVERILQLAYAPAVWRAAGESAAKLIAERYSIESVCERMVRQIRTYDFLARQETRLPLHSLGARHIEE